MRVGSGGRRLDELAEEERVAVGPVHERLEGDVAQWAFAGGADGQAAEIGVVEGIEGHRRGPGAEERSLGPAGRHDEPPALGQPPGEPAEDHRRRRVDPVGVLHQQEAGVRVGGGDEPEDDVESVLGDGSWLDGGRRVRGFQLEAEGGGGERGEGAGELGELVGRHRQIGVEAHERPQGLGDRGEGHDALADRATDREVGWWDVGGERGDQVALAHARGGDDLDDLASPFGLGGPRVAQDGELP